VTKLKKTPTWRDVQISAIKHWSPLVKRALTGRFETLGELFDAPRLVVRRAPNVGQNALDEMSEMINRAMSGEDLTSLDPRELTMGQAAIGAPFCKTCRWWGHDNTGRWVVSPKAGLVNVCGVHRQTEGGRPHLNIVTAEHDLCGEHDCQPVSGDVEGQ
jgi:hypothetical protein